MKKTIVYFLIALALVAFGCFALGFVVGAKAPAVTVERGAYGVIINSLPAGKEIML